MNVFRCTNLLNMIDRLRVFIGIRIRNQKLRRLKVQLVNRNFTIFTENCLAGVLYHDLDIQFRSPLINGGFSTEDYIKFLKNPKYYMQQELRFISNKDKTLPEFYKELDCPVACIGDLHFRFTHYHICEDEIKEIWNKRRMRINWNNLFVVLCEKKGCSIEQMEQFEALPYKNKVILTCYHYPKLECAFHIKGFESIGYIDNLLKDMPGIFPTARRFYDQFDWVKWFNIGEIDRI